MYIIPKKQHMIQSAVETLARVGSQRFDAQSCVVTVDLLLDGGESFRVRFGLREVHFVGLHAFILRFPAAPRIGNIPG